MVFCHSFLMSVYITYRGVGWQGVGCDMVKTLAGGQSSHDAYTMAHATLVGHRGSGSNLRPPSPDWCSPMVPLFQL